MQDLPRTIHAYLVCSTPRSGSTLLCDALAKTGLAGNPGEFFDPKYTEIFSRKYSILRREEYLKSIMEHCTSPNGVFGAKIHSFQLRHLAAEITPGADQSPEALRTALPRLQFI